MLSWSRISTDMKYHPYWPIRWEELKPEDLPRFVLGFSNKPK